MSRLHSLKTQYHLEVFKLISNSMNVERSLEEDSNYKIADTLKQLISLDNIRVNLKMIIEMTGPKFDLERYPNTRMMTEGEDLTKSHIIS